MSIVRFDCFEVDLAAGELRKRGVRIRLRDQPWQVLAMLLERPGQVVTRDDLQRRLWPADVIVDVENNLNTAIGRIREALGDSAEHPRFIETLPRRGYRFVATVAHAAEPAPQVRLLVLPFVNSGGDPSQDYFSDGVTDEIISELSTVAPARLAVIARTTAMHYKDTHKDIATIGRELTLDYVVEGSARRTGNRVALVVQLVRAGDQTHVFARRYEAEAGEIFGVERTVAQALAEAIGIAPGGARVVAGKAAAPVLQKRPTEDLLAYNSYVQGRYHLDRGESPASWKKARACLEDAVARDPKFAAAYDALAELWWLAGFVGQMPPKETLAIGIVHALRAVDIDNSLAEAHAMLAQYQKQLSYNWADVRREMDVALELNPASPIVRMRHAVTALMPHGRLDEAVADLQRALDVDPLAVWPRVWLGVMYWLGRQYDRAITQEQLVVQMAPTHFAAYFVLGFVCRDAGLFAEAIAASRKAADLAGNAPLMLGTLGLALAASGDTSGAAALLARLRTMPAGVYAPPSGIAWINLGLGDVDEFFTWMDRAIDERDHMIMPIKTYPFLDAVRSDSRYVDLLRKMNLA